MLGSCPSVLKVLCFPFPTVRIEPGQCEALVFHCSLPSVSWVVFSLAKEKFVQISLLRTEVFPSLSHQCSRIGEIPWSEPRTQQRLVASDLCLQAVLLSASCLCCPGTAQGTLVGFGLLDGAGEGVSAAGGQQGFCLGRGCPCSSSFLYCRGLRASALIPLPFAPSPLGKLPFP